MKKYLILLCLMLVPFYVVQAQNDNQNILFFGDSITAGNGVDTNEAFPALIRVKIDSLGWNFSVQNGGLSGETSAGGLRRINWMLQKKVNIFVLELGGNDALRGVNLANTRKNLQKIIEKVSEQYPQATIVVAGMQVPPNLGTEYTKKFREMYPQLARENDVAFIPFLMEDVGKNASLMQDDGIHPNAKGHARIAETVWNALKPILLQHRNN